MTGQLFGSGFVDASAAEEAGEVMMTLNGTHRRRLETRRGFSANPLTLLKRVRPSQAPDKLMFRTVRVMGHHRDGRIPRG